MRATFAGEKYRVQFDPDPRNGLGQRALGVCFDDRIVLKETLEGKRLLEVAIHEALHALVPEFNEERVDRTAKDLSRFLDRLGFKDENVRVETGYDRPKDVLSQAIDRKQKMKDALREIRKESPSLSRHDQAELLRLRGFYSPNTATVDIMVTVMKLTREIDKEDAQCT